MQHKRSYVGVNFSVRIRKSSIMVSRQQICKAWQEKLRPSVESWLCSMGRAQLFPYLTPVYYSSGP